VTGGVCGWLVGRGGGRVEGDGGGGGGIGGVGRTRVAGWRRDALVYGQGVLLERRACLCFLF